MIPLPIRDEPRWQWKRAFTADENAPGLARVHTRTRLTVAGWTGSIEMGARIASVLMDNAVKHAHVSAGDILVLRLAILATGEVLIEVTDPSPDFPNFTAAVEWEPADGSDERRSLWWVRQCKGRVSFTPTEDQSAKTVQVLIASGEVSA
ncbi:hypothetical protein [Streptomyces sp. 2A115]|uniref:hypothetical protein n=1 Tax=Streptomyces sp. 2A115 TaxID=3457439 RepID=UPI003FD46037